MRARASISTLAVLTLALGLFGGCETTDESSVSLNTYYGVGLYDPWYYGGYYNDVDIIVTPPDRPDSTPRPSHPIAMPPSSAPRPAQLPSIPRAAPRAR